MVEQEPIVYIVDDDKVVLDSLAWVIDTIGLKVKTYTRSQHFLNDYHPNQYGCLLLDVKIPTMSGIQLQKKLKERGELIPIIFMSAYDDVHLAVDVMKAGAFDFMLKPLNEQILLEEISKAIQVDKTQREKIQLLDNIKTKFMNLSTREKEILRGIVDGKSNKMISAEIRIALKTVEAHRASLMKKMEVKSVSKLIQLFFSIGKLSN